MNKIEIANEINDLQQELEEIRNYIHQHPELSFEEYQTADYVESQLVKFGISSFQRICKTGIVGTIGPTDNLIALRADLDALPIQEQNDVPYKSKVDGVMHACGHDVHTTCLLGALKILKANESYLKKGIRFIFQLGEEKLPGGASLMIKEGVLENPIPELIIGQHVYPELEWGKVGYKSGIYMASCDEIYIDFIGKGGHGALPHKNIDPIMITAQFLTGVQQIISRKADPKIPSVLSFGDIQGHGATNIIPDEVKLQGTFRTFDEAWRSSAHKLIDDFANHTAKSLGGEAKVNIVKGYPFLKNNPAFTEQMKEVSKRTLGAENVVDLDLRMTAEDFSYYSQKIPAVFYRLGTGDEQRGIKASVHSPHFDIAPEALSIGVKNLVFGALHFCTQD